MYDNFFLLFAMMFTGLIFRRFNIIDDRIDHGLNTFVAYFAFPCLIIYNIISINFNNRTFYDFMLTFFITGLFVIIQCIYAHYYIKLRNFPEELKNVIEFSMVSPNNGYIGIPLSLIFFGEIGLLLMTAHNVALCIYFFSYGLALMKKDCSTDKGLLKRLSFKSFFKLLINPNIFGVFIGLIISILNLPVPKPVSDYLLYMGNVATPMAMFFIGTVLARSSLNEIIKDWKIIEVTIGKLLLLPLLTFCIAYFMPLSDMVKWIIVIGFCCPTATIVAILAEQEGQDEKMACKIIFLSTIISIVSIPLTIELLSLIW